MYLNFKLILFVVFIIISSLIFFFLIVQDIDCNLFLFVIVYVEEFDMEYVLDWVINDEVSGYWVVVFDVVVGVVIMEEEIEVIFYIVEKVIVLEDGFIGIVLICWDNIFGEYGYFGLEGGNII